VQSIKGKDYRNQNQQLEKLQVIIPNIFPLEFQTKEGVQLVLIDIERKINSIEKYLAHENYDIIGYLAGNLKGLSQKFGMERLSYLFEILRHELMAPCIDFLTKTLQLIGSEFKAVYIQVQASFKAATA